MNRTYSKLSLRTDSEKKLLSLFMQAPAGIAILEGPEHVFTFTNYLYKEIFGRSESQLLGRTLREVFPEITGQGIFELFHNVYTSGDPYKADEFEAAFLYDGRMKIGYFSFVIQPIKNETGVITDLMLHVHEITKQVLASRKISESESRLQLITDALPVLISYIDKDLRYRFNNQAYERWFGHSRSDIYGKTVREILGEDAFIRIRPKMEEALAGKTGRFEGLAPYKDGGHRYIAAEYIPDIHDNEVLGFFVLVYDLTERKHNEEALIKLNADLQNVATMLSRERERLGIALRSGVLGVYEYSIVDDTIWWSPEVFQLYGVDPATFVPDTKSFTSLIHPDDREELWRKTSESISRKQEFNHEYRVIHPNGNMRWILNRSTIGVDAEGNPAQITGVAVDITDRKQVEERLEKLVMERTKALQRSNDDLQQFAHVASHDLKEPVRKIQIFTDMLRDQFDQALNEKGQQYLQKIQRATERVVIMIEGILKYSATNAVAEQPESVDLSQLISEIKDDLEIMISETNAEIVFRDLGEIHGSKVLLYQLFYNLINNSIKFSRAGVRPLIFIHSHTLRKHERNFVTIVLQDNGIGFDPEYSEMIFDTFTRLNSKDQYEGTGLGLSLARKIVERHGGSIHATGVRNEGATFTIEWPM